MGVDLTPNGSRGVNLASLPRPLRKILFGAFWLIRRLRGTPMLELSTIGAKSGKTHHVPLRYFSAGDQAWLVVASFGGAVKHPSWYFNMARNPDQVWITLRNRKIHVKPESLKGAERDSAWKRIVAEVPNYGEYQIKTDREIPVVRLTQID